MMDPIDLIKHIREYSVTLLASCDEHGYIMDAGGNHCVLLLDTTKNEIHSEPEIKAAMAEVYSAIDALRPALDALLARKMAELKEVL